MPKKNPKTSNKNLNDLIRIAYQQGWTGKKKGGSHLKLYSPDGKKIVIVAVSTRNRRAVQNTKSELKSGGVVF